MEALKKKGVEKHEATGKGARTRERILQVATDLFHAQGVNATTLGDVLRASNTGKGQFYQHFQSKDDLVLKVLEGHHSFIGQTMAAPIATWPELRQRVETYLLLQQQFNFLRGCPVGTAAYALQPQQAEARAELKQIFDQIRGAISAFLQREQKAGRLKKQASPHGLADFMVACVQGGLLLGMLERGPNPLQHSIDEGITHLQSYIKGA